MKTCIHLYQSNRLTVISVKLLLLINYDNYISGLIALIALINPWTNYSKNCTMIVLALLAYTMVQL